MNNKNFNCVNCGKELHLNDPICDTCDQEMEKIKIDSSRVPIVIMILISITLGIFTIWDILFMEFSGKVINVCQIYYVSEFKKQNCNPELFNNSSNAYYILDLFSDVNKNRILINFNEYPILFNKENYKRLFRELKRGDYIEKNLFSPYYIVNEDTYVLIGSPLQIIIFASVFIILIPIFLPKFIKDFMRDNKHLSRLKVK